MATAVTDKSLELWMKVVGLVALFTFPLLGLIGTLAVDKLNDINKALNDYIRISAVQGESIVYIKKAIDKNSNEISSIANRVIILERKP